jgi:hypothetical protein
MFAICTARYMVMVCLMTRAAAATANNTGTTSGRRVWGVGFRVWGSVNG